MTEILILIALGLAAFALFAWSRGVLARVVVYDYEGGVRYDRGRLVGAVEPGVHWILRRSSRIDKIDTRPQLVSVRG